MRKNLAIAFLSLTFFIPSVGNAARDYGIYRGGNIFGEVYFSTKYGEVTIAEDVPENGSDIRNLGFSFGKGINDILSLEFEYTQTVTTDDDYLGSDGNDAAVDTLGLFLVGKTTGRFYVKGRLGYTRVTQRFGGTPSPVDDDLEGSKNVYGLAYGVGSGIRIGKNAALELEYTIFPTRDDVTFDLGASGTTDLDLEMDFVTLNFVWSVD